MTDEAHTEMRIGNLRVINGQLVRPLDEIQRDILGRGVIAELENARLHAENLALRDKLAIQTAEIAKIREELDDLEANLEKPDDATP